MRRFLIAIACAVLLVISISPAYAKIGVGVGTGKIQVDEKLKPGIIYQLPPLSVLNTGDEVSDYTVQVAYNEKQDQLKPDASWFEFTPSNFELKPGEVKTVNVKLTLPLKAEPADYFAYLEASPTKKAQSGTTSIGVAAAAKLYFTIEPANIFVGIYYRLLSIWKLYSPWSERIVAAIAIVIVLITFKKFFNIEIKAKNSNKQE